MNSSETRPNRRRMCPGALLILALTVFILPTTSSAQLCAESPTDDDRDIRDWFSTCPVQGQNGDYVTWHYDNHRMDWHTWGLRGFNDACNSSREFTKHWLAGYLVAFGTFGKEDIDSLPPGYPYHWNSQSQVNDIDLVGRPFHFREDWWRTARGEKGKPKYHTKFDVEIHNDIAQFDPDPDDFFSAAAHFDRRGRDTVRFNCTAFQQNQPMFNSAAARGGLMIHEAWHSALLSQGYKFDHGAVKDFDESGCPLGKNCDYYYYHAKEAFPNDTLHDAKDRGFHSVYQTHYEYLCDIADHPRAWVPNSAREHAYYALFGVWHQRFHEKGPAPECGVPSPLGDAPLPGLIGECGTLPTCNSDSDCSVTLKERCSDGCCLTTVR